MTSASTLRRLGRRERSPHLEVGRLNLTVELLKSNIKRESETESVLWEVRTTRQAQTRTPHTGLTIEILRVGFDADLNNQTDIPRCPFPGILSPLRLYPSGHYSNRNKTPLISETAHLILEVRSR